MPREVVIAGVIEKALNVQKDCMKIYIHLM